jgi:hypothetical protein
MDAPLELLGGRVIRAPERPRYTAFHLLWAALLYAMATAGLAAILVLVVVVALVP